MTSYEDDIPKRPAPHPVSGSYGFVPVQRKRPAVEGRHFGSGQYV
nr:MAG TPA: hypothetical protein [Caudoviricetes sp.]